MSGITYYVLYFSNDKIITKKFILQFNYDELQKNIYWKFYFQNSMTEQILFDIDELLSFQKLVLYMLFYKIIELK